MRKWLKCTFKTIFSAPKNSRSLSVLYELHGCYYMLLLVIISMPHAIADLHRSQHKRRTKDIVFYRECVHASGCEWVSVSTQVFWFLRYALFVFFFSAIKNKLFLLRFFSFFAKNVHFALLRERARETRKWIQVSSAMRIVASVPMHVANWASYKSQNNILCWWLWPSPLLCMGVYVCMILV